MSPINLLPEVNEQEKGKRGEQTDYALLDMATTRLLDIFLAIDNGTDSKCAMSFVRKAANEGNLLEPSDVRAILENIYREVASSYATLVAARQAK